MNLKILLLIAVVILVAGIGWYGLSPLFMNKYIDEALPKDAASVDTPERAIGSEGNVSVSEPAPIVDTAAHPASGFVRIVKDGDETIIRYENYKTINGPDVRVYLANDLEAKDYVDLGPIKGTEGNINYTVPAGTDISQYRYVLTWCEDFSVLFNSADLSLTR